MVCDTCKQKPATVHVTDIVHGGAKKEVHVCEDCAQKHGMTPVPPQSMSELISGLIDPSAGREIKELLDQKCPECGITYPEFRTRGRLGCAHDYIVFRRGLEPLLDKIHGRTRHVGKVPRNVGAEVERDKNLRRLRLELDKAVKLEKYEKAAELRDEIRALESEFESESESESGSESET